MNDPQIAITPPTAQSPWAIKLSDEERDDVIDAVMSGGADESAFAENSAVGRLDCRVVAELDGTFVCEQFESVGDAGARFQFVKTLVENTGG